MARSRTTKGIDERLLLGYLFILIVGLVMVYSTSSMLAAGWFGSHWFFLRHQFVWALLSLAAMWVILKIDLARVAIYSAPALLAMVVPLSLVFLMPARNGAHRWLDLGVITVQPSELFKLLMIFYLAFSLSNPRRDITKLRQLLWPYLPIIGVGLLLILAEPDLGSTIVIFLTAAGIFFLAGARMRHLLAAALPVAGLASLVVLVLGYKKDRVLDYLAAVLNPLEGSYQLKQAALTLGSGGLFGTGLGEGRQKLFFLPYPHTDFIFAATGEEIGFAGLVVVLGLLFFLLFRGFKIAAAQPDRFGFLLASGVTWSLFVGIAINLGVVTGLLPVTGLPLPFISYGGSSLLVSSASVAVLLSLSRRVK
jgi:cell division protein FtsW